MHLLYPLSSFAMPARQNKRSSGTTTTRTASGGDAVNSQIQTASQAPWTFLSNHAHVLIVLHSEPDLVLREVALRVGITERAVQRIVQDLAEEGFLTRERVGRRNHYRIKSGKHLRHPVESHCTIDQILRLVTKAKNTGRE